MHVKIFKVALNECFSTCRILAVQQVAYGKPKHGSSEVERRIATRRPRVRNLPFLGPERIVFLSVTRVDGYVVAIIDNSYISEPSLELHSRALPSVGGITAQSAQPQGEIPEEGRTEKKVAYGIVWRLDPLPLLQWLIRCAYISLKKNVKVIFTIHFR